MTADLFGLNNAPFRSAGAWQGPQQLALAGALKRALIAPDSVVTVSGPVGSGKTTSVRHALDRLDVSKRVARIGRTHIERRDLLEKLLDELGVDPKPANALKRVDALQQALRGGGPDAHVFVLVEDAERLGAESLAELESLTAVDGMDSPGAHLIVQGTDELAEFLEHPLLARLAQRVRRRVEITAYSAIETRSFLEYCIAHAGGELESLFDDAAIESLHNCSAGIARRICAMAEAALYAASEAGQTRVDAKLVRQALRDEFGITTVIDTSAVPEFRPPATTANAEPETAAADDDIPELTQRETVATEMPELIQDTRTDLPATIDPDTADSQTMRELDSALQPDTQLLRTLDVAEPTLTDTAEPETAAAAIATAIPDAGADCDEQDVTETELPMLSTHISDVPEPDAYSQTDVAEPAEPPPARDDQPVLLDEALADASPTADLERPAETAVGAQPQETPATDETDSFAEPSSTPAEATPPTLTVVDTAAPELPEVSDPVEQETAGEPEAATATVAIEPGQDAANAAEDDLPDLSMVPEITLDGALQDHQDEVQARLAEEAAKIEAARESASGKESGDVSANRDAEEKRRMESLAARFSQARSLEDVMDDTAAETLFGEEFSQIAAAVTSMHEAVQKLDVDSDDSVATNDASHGEDTAAVDASAATASPELSLEPEPPAAPPAQAPLPSAPTGNTAARPMARPAVPDKPVDIDASAARRLEMVRALNQKAARTPAPAPTPVSGAEEIVLGGEPETAANSHAAPEPIENQFGLSMTASLKALSEDSIRAMEAEEAEDAEESAGEPKKKGGLLSRFRRS